MRDGAGTASGLYFHDAACLEHDPGEQQLPWVPEVPARLEAVESHLAALDWVGWEPREAGPATESEIALVHSRAQIARVRGLAESGGGPVDADTWVGEESYRAALHAAGAAIGMTRALIAGEAHRGFAAVRPPGHHASRDRAMGFCLFNNVAIAAECAIRELGTERILILDWDVHHGNGTNEVFRERSDVLFASIHEAGSFPGTGQRHDVGVGDGEGYSINLPVPRSSDGQLWLSLLEDMIFPAAATFEPQLVLISAGYDAHIADPIADCRLQTGSFAEMARRVRDFASASAIPVGAVLEGGYVPDVLADCVRETMIALTNQDQATAAAPEAVLASRAVASRSAGSRDEPHD